MKLQIFFLDLSISLREGISRRVCETAVAPKQDFSTNFKWEKKCLIEFTFETVFSTLGCHIANRIH